MPQDSSRCWKDREVSFSASCKSLKSTWQPLLQANLRTCSNVILWPGCQHSIATKHRRTKGQTKRLQNWDKGTQSHTQTALRVNSWVCVSANKVRGQLRHKLPGFPKPPNKIQQENGKTGFTDKQQKPVLFQVCVRKPSLQYVWGYRKLSKPQKYPKTRGRVGRATKYLF